MPWLSPPAAVPPLIHGDRLTGIGRAAAAFFKQGLHPCRYLFLVPVQSGARRRCFRRSYNVGKGHCSEKRNLSFTEVFGRWSPTMVSVQPYFACIRLEQAIDHFQRVVLPQPLVPEIRRFALFHEKERRQRRMAPKVLVIFLRRYTYCYPLPLQLAKRCLRTRKSWGARRWHRGAYRSEARRSSPPV